MLSKFKKYFSLKKIKKKLQTGQCSGLNGLKSITMVECDGVMEEVRRCC